MRASGHFHMLALRASCVPVLRASCEPILLSPYCIAQNQSFLGDIGKCTNALTMVYHVWAILSRPALVYQLSTSCLPDCGSFLVDQCRFTMCLPFVHQFGSISGRPAMVYRLSPNCLPVLRYWRPILFGLPVVYHLSTNFGVVFW